MIFTFPTVCLNSFKKNLNGAILKEIKNITNFHGRFTAKYSEVFLVIQSLTEFYTYRFQDFNGLSPMPDLIGRNFRLRR